MTQLSDFGELALAEQELIENVQRGEITHIGDCTIPSEATPDRVIRAELINFLLSSSNRQVTIHPFGLRVHGAYITGQINLENLTIENTVNINTCQIECPINMLNCRANTVNFSGSRTCGIRADGAQISGAILLRDGFHSTGLVSLAGCTVSGDVDLSGSTLRAPNEIALALLGANISGGVLLIDGFHCIGEVRIVGASIGKNLSCQHSHLENPGGVAFGADYLHVANNIFFNNVECTAGEIRFPNASVGGIVTFEGSRLSNGNQTSLNAERININGSLFFRNGHHCDGVILLSGAKIGDNLNINGGSFNNSNNYCISLASAKVGNQLIISQSKLGGQTTIVRGTIDLRELNAGSIVDDMKCWTAEGNLLLDGCIYKHLGGPMPLTVHSLHKWLYLQPENQLSQYFRPQPWTQLVSVLKAMGHRRTARSILMTREKLGFRAEHLRSQNEQRRLCWRRLYLKTKVCTSQSLERIQRADSYRARLGTVERQWAQLYFANIRLKLWNIFLHKLSGYGYEPHRSFAPIILVILLGYLTFNFTYLLGDMVPNNPVIINSDDWRACSNHENPAECWSQKPKAGIDYEEFAPLIYSFDLFIPLIDLGQETAWTPSSGRGGMGTIAYWYRWLHKIFGWIISALIAATLAGLVRRDEDY